MSDDFRILTDIEHIKLRSGMYIGSVSEENHSRFLNGIYGEFSYVSGLVKIIEEIIDNSVDEAIRTDFKFANVITVDIDSVSVKVTDNGRGIPLDLVETPEGDILPKAVLAWTRTKAGSNFDDSNRITGGMNGVGSSLTNIFSKSFTGITGNGEKELTLLCKDGLTKLDYEIKTSKKRGTSVEFIPDFNAFEAKEISDIVIEVIKDRISALSVVFPLVKFIFNGSVSTNNFDIYAKKYGEVSIFKTKTTSIGFVPSLDGFKQISYVNGLHTKSGGSHVEFIMDGVTTELIPLIKRKYKLDVSKARIKEYITLLFFTSGMNNLKFDSQTKEKLTNTAGEVKNHVDLDLVKTARELIKLDNLILPIIETELMRKEAAEKAALTRAQKAANKTKVPKHIKANKMGKESGTILLLTEGDSAIGPMLNVRDQDMQGGYPLRGKVLNTWGKSHAEMLANKEIFEMLSITGLRFGDSPFNYKEHSDNWYILNGLKFNENDELFLNEKWVSAKEYIKEADSIDKPNLRVYNSQMNVRRVVLVENISYSNIGILVDSDADGTGSIFPSLLAVFSNWPELFKQERIKFIKTPIIIATKKKDIHWFYNLKEYEENKPKLKGFDIRYLKGLGSLEENEYKEVIRNPKYDVVYLPDNYEELFEMLFGKDADLRKQWMSE